MIFENVSFEVAGIDEVRIDGELYTRTTGEHRTEGGRIVVNKYFQRERDGHLIREQRFLNKLKGMLHDDQIIKVKRETVDSLGYVRNEDSTIFTNKWRMWISGGTINIEKIIY